MRLAKLMGLTAALMMGLVSMPGTASAGGFGHFGFSGHYGGYGGHGFHPRSRAHVGVGIHGGHRFGHRRGFRRGHHGYRGHHRGGGDAAHVLLGVGAGLLLYHSLDRAHERNRSHISRDRIYRQAEPPRYAPRPSGNAAVPSGSAVATSCMQTREYTTTITFDGREVDAYGTACLQPDGSWVMGAPQQVPDFD